MKNLILLTAFLSPFLLISQTPSLDWVISGGGEGSEGSNSIVIDAQGNSYTVGGFHSSTDFNPGSDSLILNPIGVGDIFIQKLNSSGNHIWTKQIGGTSSEAALDIAFQNDSSLLICGTFQADVDFDPSASTNIMTPIGDGEAFICKLDTAGNFVWSKALVAEAGKYSHVNNIECDKNGNIYMVGQFNGTVDFDPGMSVNNATSTSSNWTRDMFSLKLNNNGDFEWLYTVGNDVNNSAEDICVDNSGNLLITGMFQDTLDFDPGPNTDNKISEGSYDAFVVKLDSSGYYIWCRQFRGIDYVQGFNIDTDLNNNIYVGGRFQQTVNFNPNSTNLSQVSNGGPDAYVCKLDSNGLSQWAHSFGGNDPTIGDMVRDLKVDQYGNVFSTGYFNGTVDFDPGPNNFIISGQGGVNGFIQKLNSAGLFLWASGFTGTESQMSKSIALDNFGAVYCTGFFNGTTDFDPSTGVYNLTPNGSDGWSDYFTMKLESCKTTPSDTSVVSCEPFEWGLTNSIYENSGMYYTMLSGEYGCDSIVTLQLTIQVADTSVLYEDDTTLVSQQANFTYQWLDCTNNFALINGETNQDYTPDISGSYAVELTLNGCVDTSSCYLIDYSGLNEYINENVTLYPNPTSEYIKIKGNLSKSIIQEIKVTNSLGRIVSRPDISSKEIDVSKLPQGLYYLNIVHKGGVEIKPFVKGK